MKTAAGAVLAVATLLLAAPALAQYYPTHPPPPPPPPGPPPGYYPPPPPPYYPPPPPPVYYRPRPEWDGKVHYTIRASGGVSFASNGYYCGYIYTYYAVGYGCGAGYSAVWPDIDVSVDVWVRPSLAVSFGTNVMWGTFNPNFTGSNQIYSTTWEPHVDILSALPYSGGDVKGRLRFGFACTGFGWNHPRRHPASRPTCAAFPARDHATPSVQRTLACSFADEKTMCRSVYSTLARSSAVRFNAPILVITDSLNMPAKAT